MTPSLPTLSMASAIFSPISRSLLAEIEPTFAICSASGRSLLWDCKDAITDLAAASIPRLMDIGFAPAVTFLRPSAINAWAKTVAVVVPSPASSDVLDATSLTICAPTSSSLFSNSISLATVTPSLVMVGAPNFFSMTTFRPLGPRVTFTALASLSTPAFRAVLASRSYDIFLAIIQILLIRQREYRSRA